MKRTICLFQKSFGMAANFFGCIMVNAPAAIALLACTVCAKVALCALIHAATIFHSWKETYWSGRAEAYIGLIMLTISVAVALFVVYLHYHCFTAEYEPAEYKDKQLAKSALYFIGFVLVSIIWTLTSSPAKIHWDGSEMFKIGGIMAIVAILCLMVMPCIPDFRGYYSEEEDNS